VVLVEIGAGDLIVVVGELAGAQLLGGVLLGSARNRQPARPRLEEQAVGGGDEVAVSGGDLALDDVDGQAAGALAAAVAAHAVSDGEEPEIGPRDRRVLVVTPT